MITATTSLRSIQEQLNQPSPYASQKDQYMQNLKSECLFKDNALRTAQNLIRQYHRENEELKLQNLRLNHNNQSYQVMIETLRRQLQGKQKINYKVYQKQQFRASIKLSNLLQKYSQLQEKCHRIQRQLQKCRNQKREEQQILQRQAKQKQRSMKSQLQKQFNHFLKTPPNKLTRESTDSSAGKKKCPQKVKNIKQLQYKNLQNQNQYKKLKMLEQSSKNCIKYNDTAGDMFFNRNQSIKKSAQKSSKVYEKERKNKLNDLQLENDIAHKLKVFQWKVKQKDEEIMLMLRRNKQIQDKYATLKTILNRKNQHGLVTQHESKKCKSSSKPTKIIRQSTQLSQLLDKFRPKQKEQQQNIFDFSKYNQIQNRHLENSQKKKSHLITKVINESTDYSIKKNFYNNQ